MSGRHAIERDDIMSNKTQYRQLLPILLVVCMANMAYAQPASVRGVFCNGSGTVGDGSTVLKAAIGQFLIGKTADTMNAVHGGFWHTIRRDVVAAPLVETPVEFRLNQNYPNPFMNKTTLPFSLPKEVDVRIGIYDLNGRLVTDIPKETLPAGHHELVLTSDGLSPGTYFCRLDAGEYTAIKTLILIR